MQRPFADLTELWQWNVLATREMCEAYGNAFLAAANRITKAHSDYLSAGAWTSNGRCRTSSG